MASGSLLPSWTDLLLRLTKKAATRQTIAATMAAAPCSGRVALARPSEAGGLVILPMKLGRECAGSIKKMMAAMISRTASTTKTMAMIVLPDDLPAALVELTSSSLKDVRRRGRLRWQPRIGSAHLMAPAPVTIRLPPHRLRSSGMTAERYYGRGC